MAAIHHSNTNHSGGETTRQALTRMLTQGEYDYEALRVALELSSRELEDELRHVKRSIRHAGGRLAVAPAQCLQCGFIFKSRANRHLHPPSRCPTCRSEHVAPPRFRIHGV